MGRNPKPGSQVTGNHLSLTEKNHLIKLESEIVGKSDRLSKGLEGLYKPERTQLRDKSAKDHYDILAFEAHNSSALGNIHISTLIELANEMSLLKQYEKDYRGKTVIFVNDKPIANPAVKMRQDTLKSINAMKSELGLGAIDIITLARQRAEMNETDSLQKLFGDGGSDEDWEEKQ
ncbi:hypothetical protein ACIP97_24275 [Peribacillus frigoritolerans]|uniref:hypothetical protein n=1 Tax=Peribacillus frigoritolerans TaxID=450367 RepID=UPI0037FC0F7D